MTKERQRCETFWSLGGKELSKRTMMLVPHRCHVALYGVKLESKSAAPRALFCVHKLDSYSGFSCQTRFCSEFVWILKFNICRIWNQTKTVVGNAFIVHTTCWLSYQSFLNLIGFVHFGLGTKFLEGSGIERALGRLKKTKIHDPFTYLSKKRVFLIDKWTDRGLECTCLMRLSAHRTNGN